MVKLGGMMKKLHLLLVGGLIIFGLHCASTDRSPAQPNASATAKTEASRGPSLTAIRVEAAPTPHLLLQTSGSPAYTSYSPQPDVFVVDLPRTVKAADLATPATLPDFITSIAADEAVELGSPLTRVTIRLNGAVSPRTSVTDGGVMVAFGGAATASSAPAPAIEPVAPVSEPQVQVSEIAEPAAPPVASPSAPAVKSEIPRGPKATRLLNVTTSGSGPSLQIVLAGDGVVEYKAFRLANPQRIVLDLQGVLNEVKTKSIPLGDPFVKSVRVSQFKGRPDAVTRVVLDLDDAVDYHVQPTTTALRLSFGGDSIATADVEPAPAEPAPASYAPVTVASNDVAPGIEPVAAEHLSAPMTTHVINASADQAPPTRAATATVSTAATSPVAATSEDVFSEAGSATQNITGANVPSRTLSGSEKLYTGEPIDIHLKDADIKDVLRFFAQITGLNIAVDPTVTGTVTVDFSGVPWDQALDIILRQNGLGYELEGNVMRIGTIDRLSQEQAQQRKLEEDKRLNVALTTVSHKLSYSKAQEVQSLLKDLASPRGRIIVDQRTNQLIITEIPQYLQTMLNMIETIDIPTPQVTIEARIVETTKNFSQQLGVSWGFMAKMVPELGTGTGLEFPNRVIAEGGPFNFASGNPVLGLTLGNVLGTFDLDLTLTAAENEGLVRIVSAPKITTQDNIGAQIESGVQIPIQTRVNFTTTVQYINATLQLSVTPQITDAGTVIMDIQVQKIEPGVGLSVIGAQNVPLITRRAQTRLMVRDGSTSVIGGIYQATDNNSQTRMPFVHSIPVIGNLFKNKDISARHDELLIFITPRIVRNT